MDNPVVVSVAAVLAECRYAPLRFNWRGMGASSGRPSGDVDDAVEDYAAALKEARRRWSETGSGDSPRILAAGYSFGSIAAAHVAAETDDVHTLLLVAPPVAMLEAVDLSALEMPVRAIVGERDSFAPVHALSKLLSRARDARLDVVPDADHFFASPLWIERLDPLVRAVLT